MDFKQMTTAGRTKAVKELNQAAIMAIDAATLKESMATLQVMASHILATLIFNQVLQHGVDTQDVLKKAISGIELELAMIGEVHASGQTVYAEAAAPTGVKQ